MADIDTGWCFYFLLAHCIVRFDIRGLSPGSSEDEAGIKEASDLCEKFCVYSAHYYYYYMTIDAH